MKHSLSFVAAAVLWLGSATASAQTTAAPAAVSTGDGYTITTGATPATYEVSFGDDPLAAGGFDPNGAMIRVSHKALRATLIRPRTSFVGEMLKTVENL